MSQTIIDSNALQSPALRNYLAKSRNNFAVLTDYAAMEAYKMGASIFRSMTILADFPTQTIILKTTGVVCGLRGRQSGLRRRMIDRTRLEILPAIVEIFALPNTEIYLCKNNYQNIRRRQISNWDEC